MTFIKYFWNIFIRFTIKYLWNIFRTMRALKMFLKVNIFQTKTSFYFLGKYFKSLFYFFHLGYVYITLYYILYIFPFVLSTVQSFRPVLYRYFIILWIYVHVIKKMRNWRRRGILYSNIVHYIAHNIIILIIIWFHSAAYTS